MVAISVRLPDEIESRLSREAQLGQRTRSEIVRDAIEQYLKRREHERFMETLVEQARAAYRITDVRRESRELLDEAEQDAGSAPDEDDTERWWL
jgi:predicted transcriptional regulator